MKNPSRKTSLVSAEDASFLLSQHATPIRCEINTIDIDTLFSKYREVGFLYPEKLRLMQPYMQEIVENWKRVLQLDDQLLWTIEYKEPNQKIWGAITHWKSTQGAWVSQHAVSLGNPKASAYTLLETCAKFISDGNASSQISYRPQNRWPKRVFGTATEVLGEEKASYHTLSYFSVSKHDVDTFQSQSAFKCVELNRISAKEKAFIVRCRGKIFFKSQEFESDPNLDLINDDYKKVGLLRDRRIYVAVNKDNEIKGMALAYRGPIGLNFTFLENRCDLLIDESLPDEEIVSVFYGLAKELGRCYGINSLAFILIVCSERIGKVIGNNGARFLRHYCQAIWLRNGFLDLRTYWATLMLKKRV